jgi:N-acetylmuramoyl-L-alanine amidase
VSDIQRRLAGILPVGAPIDQDGYFGPATRAAVEAFQHHRGLRVDGICEQATWNTLVEASFRLGDRYLYRRAEMLRGDDVAELQQRLCSLGFDAGRVDGIFGDRTSEALSEFQRNAGLPIDGLTGGATLRELIRLESRHEEPELVSSVRARAKLRDAPRTLSGRHVAIGESGGLGSVSGALRRRLLFGGTRVTELHHPDDSTQAQQANELAVDVYIGLKLDPLTPECRTSFWSGNHDESQGGKLLAELVQRSVPVTLGIRDGGAHGMRMPILRETRMPSVLVELGPASVVVERATLLAAALSSALDEWADASWE